jgi:hypothetical protein
MMDTMIVGLKAAGFNFIADSIFPGQDKREKMNNP